MNIYCGTDIIEVDRIKKAISSTPNFKEKIFTTNEINYSECKNDVVKYCFIYTHPIATKSLLCCNIRSKGD